METVKRFYNLFLGIWRKYYWSERSWSRTRCIDYHELIIVSFFCRVAHIFIYIYTHSDCSLCAFYVFIFTGSMLILPPPPHFSPQINTLMANGDKNSLRKAVTENMFSVCHSSCQLPFSYNPFVKLFTFDDGTLLCYVISKRMYLDLWDFILDFLINRRLRMKLNKEKLYGSRCAGNWSNQLLKSELYVLVWLELLLFSFLPLGLTYMTVFSFMCL